MKKWIVTISAAFSTLDLFWKDRIEKRPDSAKEEEMFGGKIRIRKVHNYGFALGTLSGEDRLVKGGSLGAGILLLIYYMKLLFSKKGKWKFAGTSLMLSGAVSNLYDRLKRGYVVDYIDVRLIGFAVFNLADCCVVIGTILALIYILILEPRKEKKMIEEIEEDVEEGEQELAVENADEVSSAEAPASDVNPPEPDEEPSDPDEDSHA